MPDPVALTRSLIRCPSVTPAEGGAITLLEALLTEIGFVCTRVDRGGIANLYARWGTSAPLFAFAGHTDVVPVGNLDAWSVDPFGGEERDGKIWGRGAADMKSGVASFVAACARFVQETPPEQGSICLIITGDEEGDARDGTLALLDWMRAKGEMPEFCLVGEPTCPETFGQMMKIGRRGSVNFTLTARGLGGHVAYPDRALNPLPALLKLLLRLESWELDRGNAHFDPSSLVLTSVDVGNAPTNVIPGAAQAKFNIRFNSEHRGEALVAHVASMIAETEAETGVKFEMESKISGEAFLTAPGRLSDLIGASVKAQSGLSPELSTSGGTSDARFIKDLCPVVEFGLVGKTMHQVDEHVALDDILALTEVYQDVLRRFFAR
ncbi:MAG: succinyl-diaminopimelate desuccinylase [Neomegalonema sp.]|nr:succinyl-diaminopimelate desuccinylase [Neomegalonema sp.]